MINNPYEDILRSKPQYLSSRDAVDDHKSKALDMISKSINDMAMMDYVSPEQKAQAAKDRLYSDRSYNNIIGDRVADKATDAATTLDLQNKLKASDDEFNRGKATLDLQLNNNTISGDEYKQALQKLNDAQIKATNDVMNADDTLRHYTAKWDKNVARTDAGDVIDETKDVVISPAQAKKRFVAQATAAGVPQTEIAAYVKNMGWDTKTSKLSDTAKEAMKAKMKLVAGTGTKSSTSGSYTSSGKLKSISGSDARAAWEKFNTTKGKDDHVTAGTDYGYNDVLKDTSGVKDTNGKQYTIEQLLNGKDNRIAPQYVLEALKLTAQNTDNNDGSNIVSKSTEYTDAFNKNFRANLQDVLKGKYTHTANLSNKLKAVDAVASQYTPSSSATMTAKQEQDKTDEYISKLFGSIKHPESTTNAQTSAGTMDTQTGNTENTNPLVPQTYVTTAPKNPTSSGNSTTRVLTPEQTKNKLDTILKTNAARKATLDYKSKKSEPTPEEKSAQYVQDMINMVDGDAKQPEPVKREIKSLLQVYSSTDKSIQIMKNKLRTAPQAEKAQLTVQLNNAEIRRQQLMDRIGKLRNTRTDSKAYLRDHFKKLQKSK